jgi:hypothetical protein
VGAASVKNYRVYRIDGVGRISGGEWFEAADDQLAAEQAVSLNVDGGAIELWSRDRFIARIESPREITATTPPERHDGTALA